jgi:hypothetical protein
MIQREYVLSELLVAFLKILISDIWRVANDCIKGLVNSKALQCPFKEIAAVDVGRARLAAPSAFTSFRCLLLQLLHPRETHVVIGESAERIYEYTIATPWLKHRARPAV